MADRAGTSKGDPVEHGTAVSHGPAVLDEAHVGDIRGAFGSIAQHDTAARRSWRARLLTLAAIVGPGLIVMVGDNDAGGVATYAQAGQNYGLSLLWTLPLLVPVLIVNQEMVVRLGAVTGVGHARLIKERFGRFWGAFSVGDLFVLNFLTISTEFIGVSLALGFFGVSEYVSVPLAAAGLVAMTVTGSFRRWERFMLLFVFANFLVIPLVIFAHPRAVPVVHGLFVPGVRGGFTSTSVLLVIAIVGTTVAPWQLFFQQSNIVDKRITPRWINYERMDTVIGSVITVVGASALVATTGFAFAGTRHMGHFADAGDVARLLDAVIGHGAGALFAIVLLNASIIGAAAVTLATSYAFGDIFGARHSLHRPFREAKGFYSLYVLLIVCAAAIVLVPHAPLGLITTSVQALAGVLLPAATVFLVLLCNDPAVLGPWVNRAWLNVVSGIIVGALVLLSLVLMVATVFPSVDVARLFVWLAVGGGVAGAVLSVLTLRSAGGRGVSGPGRGEPAEQHKVRRETWRMPQLALLERPAWSRARSATLAAMWVYLALAVAILAVKAVELGTGGH